MSVEQIFESNQAFQLEAVAAVVDLFEGWLPGVDAVVDESMVDMNQIEARGITQNTWGINDSLLLENAKRVQERTRSNLAGELVPVVPEKYRLTEEQTKEALRDFTIEMETGTGKTYVYLRTALELNRKYGMKKFIIVVPRVAIREGVLTSLRQTKQHFKELFDGITIHGFAYDSSQIGELKQFATEDGLQIMVINVQAFANDKALIHKADYDRLQGHRPIDFITKTRPVIILDEPQLLDGKKWGPAINELNPLFKIRYSATHKDKSKHCMVYRLGPIDAYERKLVKKIHVLSVSPDEDRNIAFVGVLSVDSKADHASVLVNKHDRRSQITIRQGDDLEVKTQLKVYRGWTVEQIHAQTETTSGSVEFSNGRVIKVHENSNIESDWLTKTQFQATIEAQFEKELQLSWLSHLELIKPTKALTLFFIDKVDNYWPDNAIYRTWFEEIYEQVRSEKRFSTLNLPTAKEAHLGYFAKSGSKVKDSKGEGNSADDAEAYRLIMQGKEELLDVDNKVRFIFSHSALSEGWDNPNVFTICHLQETKSTMTRRQQIGRGLRLPVMSDGKRCREQEVNVLRVIAREAFADFANGLQTEFRKEADEQFGPPIVNERQTKVAELKEDFSNLPGFSELWELVKRKTTYRFEFRSEHLIESIVHRMKMLKTTNPITAPRVRVKNTEVVISYGGGVQAGRESEIRELQVEYKMPITDVVGGITKATGISRASVVQSLQEIARDDEILLNPMEFIAQYIRCAKEALGQVLVEKNGIVYYEDQSDDGSHKLDIFPSKQTVYGDNVVEVKRSITQFISCDSQIEKDFASAIDNDERTLLFVKLPDKFKVSTPIGGYNPDWAIVRLSRDGNPYLYLVRETKGSTIVRDLRFESEGWKIFFGMKHFNAIAVDFNIAKVASDLDIDIPLKDQFRFEFDTLTS